MHRNRETLLARLLRRHRQRRTARALMDGALRVRCQRRPETRAAAH